MIQECGAGLLPIQVHPDGRATLSGGTPTVGPELDPRPLLAAASLSDLDYTGPAPRMAGCGGGVPVPVRYARRRWPRAAADPAAMRAHNLTSLCLFSWDAQARTAHTRMFAPGLGVPEDPATGSAALGFGVWLVAAGLLPADGDSSYTIRQGAEILRPSTLECTVTASGGRAVATTVTGQVAPVARGEIAIP